MTDDRRRLAGVMASAGLSSRSVAAEILFLLPEPFIRAYEELYNEAWGIAAGGRGDGGKGKNGTVEAAGVGGRSGRIKDRPTEKLSLQVKSKRALEVKKRVDKKLRLLVGEMGLDDGEKDGEGGNGRKVKGCRVCGLFTGIGWNYCARCGAKLSLDPEGVAVDNPE